MTQLPQQISNQLRDTLSSRGYDPDRIYQVNRLPNFAIPRTFQYNLTTAALAGISTLGLIFAKRKGYYSAGFSIALGLTFGLDYMHRRQLDNTSVFSQRSSGSFQFDLQKYPDFKKAYEKVSGELDSKIAELENQRLKYLP